MRFTGLQARAIGRGIAAYSRRAKLLVWACAILPDHVHLVLGPHRLAVDQIVIQVKGDATKQLIHENLHPFEPVDGRRPKCFARGQWRVFLDTEADVARAIRYVEENPIREGLPPQRWTFVTPPG